MMPFPDQILAGTTLIREAIESENYVTGVTGWTIRRDGTAEFLDAVFRGVVDINNTGGDGTNPGLWIGPASHADFPPELLVLEGINDAVYAQVNWFNADTFDATVLTTESGTVERVWRVSVNRLSTVDKVTIHQQVTISGGAAATCFVTLTHGSGDNGLRTDGSPAVAHLFKFASVQIGRPLGAAGDMGETPFTIDGISAGRGLHNKVSSLVNSAAIGAEAITLTLPSTTYYAGRAYRVEYRGLTYGSVANNVLYQMRKTNLAGAIFMQARFGCQAGAGNAVIHRDTFHMGRAAGGSNFTDALVLTMTASAGTATQAGGANFPRWITVYDAGAIADFPDAVLL